MFTGIIETFGVVESVTDHGSGKTFLISSSLTTELKVDQSVAHDGVCLTIEKIDGNYYQATAVQETLLKTNLGTWSAGYLVNIERCMLMNGRLDGHIVQGHVDTTGVCIERKELDGSWEFRFQFPPAFSSLIIEKGSICLNGTSFTLFNVSKTEFSIAVIPYTYEHTNIKSVKKDSVVNLEFDVIGKYVQRLVSTSQ